MQLYILALFSGISPPHFKQEESPFLSSFAKPFRGSTVPAFPAIRCFPFLAVGHAPFYRQRKRSLGFARDDDTRRTRFPHTLSLHDARDIHSLHCHFERSEKSFSSLFSMTPSLCRLREAPFPPFLRYGVSHFSLSGTLPFTANEKDPSASLGMTIRETCFLNTIFSRSTEMPISRLFTSLSFISRL